MPVIACPDCGRDVSTLAPVCPHCGRPSPAGTAPVMQAAPVAQEQQLWRGTPSAIKLLGRGIEIVLILVIVPLVFRWFARQTNELETSANILRIGWWLTALLVIVTAVRMISALAQLRSTLYTITNQRVIIEHGIVSKALEEIDLRYVDDIRFFQGPVDRLLGIGNVTIVSADKTAPVVVLNGIQDPRRVRELIRAHAYQVSQREIFTRAT